MLTVLRSVKNCFPSVGLQILRYTFRFALVAACSAVSALALHWWEVADIFAPLGILLFLIVAEVLGGAPPQNSRPRWTMSSESAPLISESDCSCALVQWLA